MKILRRNNDFKKMPDSSINDVVAIKALIDYGWKYCSKKEYKEFFGTKNDSDKKDDDFKSDSTDSTKKVEKKKKHGKNK